MEIKIQPVHFNTIEKSETSIEKKVGKLEKTLENIREVEVQLRLTKSVTALNKQAAITITVSGNTLFTEKTCDIFKEGTDLCVDVMRVQISKYKEEM